MNVLYLSHCVPYPPNKGEKIRAYHQLRALAEKHSLHLACFARNEEDLKFAEQLRSYCDSVYAEPVGSLAMASALLRFLAGSSINMALFESRSLRKYIAALSKKMHFDVAVAYTVPVATYMPRDLPFVLDLVDVDSEKWFQYAKMRTPGSLYRIEAERLRAMEGRYSRAASSAILTTYNEAALLRSFTSGRIGYVENGVNFEVFHPTAVKVPPELQGRRYLVFVGTMDYYPNIDAVLWFAKAIFPELKNRFPDVEFLIVGHRPTREVSNLAQLPGITVTGGVPDIRPYILGSRAMVAPLRIARGIQNKVLEALALGVRVFGSAEVCITFGEKVPADLIRCISERDYLTNLPSALEREPARAQSVPDEIYQRFNWENNGAQFLSMVEEVAGSHRAQAVLP